jgi:hypothetical protein
MSLLAYRLMRLIETNAESLAETLESGMANSERCATYSQVSSGELKTLVVGVYAHLGQWLVSNTEEDIERVYTMVGARRAEQGIPVSQLLWCLVLMKENLWDFVKDMEGLESTAEVFGVLELMQMVDQFFNRAMYYAVRRHEQVDDTRPTELKS